MNLARAGSIVSASGETRLRTDFRNWHLCDVLQRRCSLRAVIESGRWPLELRRARHIEARFADFFDPAIVASVRAEWFSAAGLRL